MYICIYIYIYIAYAIRPMLAAAAQGRLPPLVVKELRGHAERSHSQKSDLMILINVNCRE